MKTASKDAQIPASNSGSKPEIILVPVDTDGISCDGGHPSLGHPRVWYVFGEEQQIDCRYCDRVFRKIL